MREELKNDDLEMISGGRYAINNNTGCLYFETIPGEFHLKVGGYVAAEAMDQLIGKYPSEAAYDQACIAMLKEKGYID